MPPTRLRTPEDLVAAVRDGGAPECNSLRFVRVEERAEAERLGCRCRVYRSADLKGLLAMAARPENQRRRVKLSGLEFYRGTLTQAWSDRPLDRVD